MYYIEDPIWLKLGDLILNEVSENLINSALDNLTGSSDLATPLQQGFKQHYRYRYICVNDFNKWLNLFISRCSSLKPEFNLRLNAFLELNPNFFLLTQNLTALSTSENEGKTNISSETNSTDTTINTQRNLTTDHNNGVSTSNSKDIDTRKYRSTNVRSGSETDLNTLNTTTGVDGTNSSTTSTIDNSVTTIEESSNQGEIGVKTTNVVPAADRVEKTIARVIAPPQNVSGYVTGQEENQKVYADNINNTSAFEVSNTYNSQVQENLTYSNLQRESNGNYKSNITTETYGQLNTTTGLYEPLKTESDKHSVTTSGRAAGSEFNTEVTQSVENGQITTNTGTTTLQRTYNNVTDTSNYEGLDDADNYNFKHNETLSDTYTNSKSFEGMDDSTHNLTNTQSGSTSSTTSNNNSNTTTSTNRGFSGNMSQLYMDYIDAIEKNDIIVWFYKSFDDLFSGYLQMDDRDVYDVEEAII